MDTSVKDFSLGFVITALCITTVFPIEQDVCVWDTFQATCTENEVIKIEHALYGRMAVGTCIPQKAGYEMGCKEDMSMYLDYICSGRQSCELRLSDYLNKWTQPCSRGFESYLQVQYNCIPVHVSLTSCASGPLPVSGKQGLLANVITGLTGQGSSECPWVVRGSPGQKVRLILHDFGIWKQPTSRGGGSEGRELVTRIPERSDICRIYARVTEGSSMRSITLCGGETREKIVYISETKSLQIALTNPKQTENAAYFLLKYEIVGCPDYLPPKGVVVDRHENDITVKCPDTGSEWHLSCDGTRWNSKDEITNCTASGGPSINIGTVFKSVLTLPQWILIMMILAVAVIIAVPILVIGCLSFRRKRDPVIAPPPILQMDTGQTISDPDYTAKERDPMLAKREILHTSLQGREYTTTAQRQLAVRPGAGAPDGRFPPLPQPPTTAMSDANHCIAHGTLGNNRYPRDCRQSTFKPPYTEHKYESPVALRRTRSDIENTSTIYNELGPDNTNLQTATRCEHAEYGIETPEQDPLESTLPE